jgi:DNA-binding NarL/FixJ family response regulator
MTVATHPLSMRRPVPVMGTAHRPRPATQAVVVHRADVVRAGVTAVLVSAGDCHVHQAASVYEALRIGQTHHPQLVLFDFGPQDGPEACRLLAGIWPRPRLLALVDDATLDPRVCLEAGADGAVAVARVSREAFLGVVGQLLAGVRPLVAGFGPVGRDVGGEESDAGPLGLLTPREREMLFLIGEGLSNREIADALVLSVKTVEAHRANLARKLGIRSRAGLMRLALSGMRS